MVTAGVTANTTEGNSRAPRESGLLCSHSHRESIDTQRSSFQFQISVRQPIYVHGWVGAPVRDRWTLRYSHHPPPLGLTRVRRSAAAAAGRKPSWPQPATFLWLVRCGVCFCVCTGSSVSASLWSDNCGLWLYELYLVSRVVRCRCWLYVYVDSRCACVLVCS